MRYSGGGELDAGGQNLRIVDRSCYPSPTFLFSDPCRYNKLPPSCTEPQPTAFPVTMDCIPLSHNSLVVGEVLALWTSRLGNDGTRESEVFRVLHFHLSIGILCLFDLSRESATTKRKKFSVIIVGGCLFIPSCPDRK